MTTESKIESNEDKLSSYMSQSINVLKYDEDEKKSESKLGGSVPTPKSFSKQSS